jgi:hypothetical protein
VLVGPGWQIYPVSADRIGADPFWDFPPMAVRRPQGARKSAPQGANPARRAGFCVRRRKPRPQGANHARRAGFAARRPVTGGRVNNSFSTGGYTSAQWFNCDKYLFLEIAFLSCHVSIKRNWPYGAFWHGLGRPPPYGRATATGGRHQISKTCQPA